MGEVARLSGKSRSRMGAGTCGAVFLLIISPYFLPGIPPLFFQNYIDFWIENALVCLVIGALLRARRHHTAKDGRLFWNLSVVAFGFWLAGRTIWGLLYPYGLAVDIISDLLYLMLFVVLMVAFEYEPGRLNLNPFEQRLRQYAVAGGTVLLLASYGYFGLLPALLTPEIYDSWQPAVVGTVVLDIYLLIRFAMCWRQSRNPQWRRNFGWLTAAFGLWAVTDLLNAFWYYDVGLVLTLGTLWDLLWYVPYLVMALAVVTASPSQTGRIVDEATGEPSTGTWHQPVTPLVAYAFSMPLLHGTLIIFGLGNEDLRSPREVLLFVEAVILAVLIFRTHRMILRENARLSREHQSISSHLAEANRDLETEVVNRTLELESVNHELEADIEKRKLVASQLTKSEQHNRALLAAVPEVLLRVGPDDFIREMLGGTAAADPLGMAGAIGQALVGALPDANRAEISTALTLARAGQTPRTVTVVIGTGEAAEHCEIRCSDCGDGDVLVLVQDITRRRALELTLQQSQKLESLGLMAGGIAHDFNNLLTGILGNAELARDEFEANPDLTKALDSIESNALRAAKLTGNLLAYAGNAHIKVEVQNLNQLVVGLTDLMGTAIPKNVSLEMDLDSEVQWIEGNEAQLTQILLNLIQNAKEAIGRDTGTITVSLKSRTVVDDNVPNQFWGEVPAIGSFVELEVRDTGCGIPAAAQQRIFDPFFTSKGTGRGLGLAAVLGIISKHQGMLTLDSADGQGTVFRILFPAATAPSAAKIESPTAAAAVACSTVLVVDDEPEVRQMVVAFLQQKGIRSLEAENGAAGIALFKARRDEVDAVVMDYAMPVMDGAEAHAVLRREAPRLPIVMISGFGTRQDLEALDDGPWTEFLAKPFRLADLGQRLNSVCKGYRRAEG